jgi:hypothetical protein
MKRQLMYLGERVRIDGKIHQCFRDKRGKEYHWMGVKGLWFGSVYVSEDDKMAVRPEAVESDWKPSDEDIRKYEANKILVRARRQANQKAFEFKKPHPDLMKAVSLVRPFYLMISEIDRRRFMEWFSNECSKRVKKK